MRRFELATHRGAAPDPDHTACWSPFSVVTALALACATARGPTRDELRTALTGGEDLATWARLLSPAAEPGGDAHLALAGTAWLRADLTAAGTDDAGTDDVSDADGLAALESLTRVPVRGFDPDPRQARLAINADVAETTRGLIPDLLDEDAITRWTYALLVSALYLRVSWAHPFPERATTPRRFDAPTGPVEVPTMELVADLGYADTGRWQVVALPASGDVEAAVLLPRGALAAAEAALTGPELDELLRDHPSRRVRLRLPRLRIAWGDDLVGALRSAGIRTLFDPDLADLTGLTPVRPLWVSRVAHRAVLRVDEAGVEGAAATALIAAGRALGAPPPQPLLVAVDRPFLLVVRHRRSGVVYFLARVTDPS